MAAFSQVLCRRYRIRLPTRWRGRFARGYRNPSLSTVRIVEDRPDRPEVQHWTRQFDGADIVGTNAVTVWATGAWQTHWYKEVHEPPPIRRGAVISDSRARASAGLDPATKSTTRLVQVAVFKQIYKVPHPTNAMDVDNVIDCYRPSIEVRKLDHDGDITYAHLVALTLAIEQCSRGVDRLRGMALDVALGHRALAPAARSASARVSSSHESRGGAH